MKVKLRTKPCPQYPGEALRQVTWNSSLPFLVNPRGVLIHRVRHACTYMRDGKVSHHVASYWCGNNGRGLFTDNPTTNKLLCSFCEARAVANGEKPADVIAGRHVHIGVLRGEQICCKEHFE